MAVPLTAKATGAFLRLHQLVYERTDGRIGKSIGSRPMLMLRTTGRRTGEPRVSALLYVRDDDDYVVVASAGGRDSHPGWYFNVTAGAPSEIQIGRERTAVIGSVATGERRKRLWAEADRVNKGGYTRYQANTEREIPVVILSPT